MHYRRYIPADFAALYALEEACFPPPFRFPRDYMLQLVSNPENVTLVAAENGPSAELSLHGTLAGFAIAECSRRDELVLAYLATIEVESGRRGRGIADELLRRIEQAVRELGATVLWLHVDERNAGAIRLYKRHGYRLEGMEEDYYPEGRAASVYSKRILNKDDR